VETKGYIESKVESKSQGNLKAILYLLQNNLEEFGREVNSSYELLKLGEKTKLTEAIEHALNDPMGNINNISLEIDQQIKNMLDIFVGSFFNFKKEIVHSAYRNDDSGTNLTYYIVLKVDNYETRDSMFDFFDKYDEYEISYRYKIFFQFVPIEFESKIRAKHKLQLLPSIA